MIFEGLELEIRKLLRQGVREPLPDSRFNELALEVFRFQYEENPAYRRFVDRRGADPEEVTRWEDVPFLPTGAFKEAILVSGDPSKVERVFRTSGTTQGVERRGEHHILDLSLYRSSLLSPFEAHLLPDLADKIRILCLLPNPEVVPDSSLGFMMGEVMKVRGAEGSGFHLSREGRVDGQGFGAGLQEARASGDPVLVAGTAFAFVQWWEYARDPQKDHSLPGGSRILETGGYKGRSTELTRRQLYSALEEAFGIPADHMVNEYGMTELLSQFYESVMPGSPGFAGPVELEGRSHVGPPWTRTLVLDPMTLAPVREGQTGVLAHFDLANLASVSAILTEDLGRRLGSGFQLLGRSAHSEPRGCSLSMEDFLASRRTL